MSMMKTTALALMLASLICAGCATTGGATDEAEPTLIETGPPAAEAARRSRKRLPNPEEELEAGRRRGAPSRCRVGAA